MCKSLLDLKSLLKQVESEYFRLENILGGRDLLFRGLEDVLKSGPNVETDQQLNDCWQLLSRTVTSSAIRKYCCRQLGKEFNHDRLFRNVCGLFATACCARTANNLEMDAEAPRQLLHWVSSAASCLAQGDAVTVAAGELNLPSKTTPDEAINRAFQQFLSNSLSSLIARYWTLWWLRKVPEPMKSIRVPVVGYGHAGFSAELELLHLGPLWTNILFEHPELCLVPIDEQLRNCMQAAHMGTDLAVCWNLRVVNKSVSKGHSQELGGDSLAAAAFAAFACLRYGRPYDPHALLMARVEGEKLQPVGHEREKLEWVVRANSFCQESNDSRVLTVIRRVGLAADDGGRISLLQRDFPTLQVTPLLTVADAIEFVSRDAAEVRDFIRWTLAITE